MNTVKLLWNLFSAMLDLVDLTSLLCACTTYMTTKESVYMTQDPTNMNKKHEQTQYELQTTFKLVIIDTCFWLSSDTQKQTRKGLIFCLPNQPLCAVTPATTVIPPVES